MVVRHPKKERIKNLAVFVLRHFLSGILVVWESFLLGRVHTGRGARIGSSDQAT